MTAQSMKSKGAETKKSLLSLLSNDPKHPSRLYRRAKVSVEYARTLLVQLVAEGKAEVMKVGRAKHYKLAPRRRAAKKAPKATGILSSGPSAYRVVIGKASKAAPAGGLGGTPAPATNRTGYQVSDGP